mgnify:CR=1 FL=1
MSEDAEALLQRIGRTIVGDKFWDKLYKTAPQNAVNAAVSRIHADRHMLVSLWLTQPEAKIRIRIKVRRRR